MTYEEAIKNINALNAVCGQKDLYDAEFESALALAIESLEKQIPKKPIIREAEDYFGYVEHILCPNCEKVDFGYEHPCFCKLCGQAIDWEDGAD